MIKQIVILLMLSIYLMPFSVKAEVTKDDLENIGRFLILDFYTAESASHKKPLTNVFYVKEIGNKCKITDYDIALLDLKGILQPGEYKEIMIINEVSDLGLLARKAFISLENDILWSDNTTSLKKFIFTPSIGNMSRGVTQVMKYKDAETIADLFKECQKGEIPINWVPSENSLDFYYKTLDVFYTLSTRLL